MRSALFCDITQHVVVIPYRRFRTPTCPILKDKKIFLSSFLDSGALIMGPIGFLRTSIGDYHFALRNILEERRCRSQNASLAQLKNFHLELVLRLC